MPQRMQMTLLGLIAAAIAVPALAASQPGAAHDTAPQTEAVEARESHETHEKLAPAKRYSGGAPVDMSHGALGNNGTYGAPNPEYEAQAKAELLAPGLFVGPYPYERRAEFIAAMNDQMRFFEEAVTNLKETSSITKPEAKQHSGQAVQQLENLLGQTKDALKRAKSAASGEWAAAQDSARTAFTSLYGTYKSLNTAK